MIFENFLKRRKKNFRDIKKKAIVKVIRDIRTSFEQEKEEDYYEPKRVSYFWKDNYVKY